MDPIDFRGEPAAPPAPVPCPGVPPAARARILERLSGLDAFFTGGLEFDSRLDGPTAWRFAEDVWELLKLFAVPASWGAGVVLRLGRLGRHRADGLYFPDSSVLAVDTRALDSFAHELGHLIDYRARAAPGDSPSRPVLSAEPGFLGLYVELRRSMAAAPRLRARLHGARGRVSWRYYASPPECFARAFEQAAAERLRTPRRVVKRPEALRADPLYFPVLPPVAQEYFRAVVLAAAPLRDFALESPTQNLQNAGFHPVGTPTLSQESRCVPHRKLSRCSLSIVLALALAACTPRSESGGGGSGGYRVAVIPKGTTHGFWQSVHAGALKAEQELKAAGLNVAVVWKGPPKEDDREQQIQVVENFISAGVSGIVLAPLDDQALVKPVRDAVAAKIPVVIFDSGLEGEAGKDYVAYVATDNKKGGVLAAERLGQVMGGKGKAILLRYQEGSASTTLREEGFLETIKAKFPAIELLSQDQFAGATMEKAQETSQNLLVRYRDQVEGIFTPNESSTFGMLRALQGAGLAGKVKFVGFDSSRDLMTAMERQEIHGLVLQNPIHMGYLAVKTLVEHLQSKPVARETDTGAMLVTPENMHEPAMKLLHSPDLTPWLKS